MNAREDVDVAALEAELRKNIRGEVRFSDGDRALYSTDSSNYRQIPIGVVIPRDRSDVIVTVAAAEPRREPVSVPVGEGAGYFDAGAQPDGAVVDGLVRGIPLRHAGPLDEPFEDLVDFEAVAAIVEPEPHVLEIDEDGQGTFAFGGSGFHPVRS